MPPPPNLLTHVAPEVGITKPISPFSYFPNFSTSPKYMLAIEYHVHIWQVSPQLSCSDTCQIWMRLKERNRYFCQIENFAYGEIDKQSFSNPHPWTQWVYHTETDRSSGWLPWSSLEMLKLAFNISSDKQGSHPDIHVSVALASPHIQWNVYQNYVTYVRLYITDTWYPVQFICICISVPVM